MEKLTNVKALEMVLEMELGTELREKLEKMKATFEKKNSNSGELTATQKENLVIKDKIVDFLGTVEKATVTEIMKGLDTEYSNQKVSSLVRQLVENGTVVRVEEKRKAYFSLKA